MPWFKVDDDFHDHPKVKRLGTGPVGLWTLCGGWSADQLTDGRVPLDVVKAKGGKNWRRMATQLVDAGLWVEVGPDDNERTTREHRENRSRRDTPTAYQFHDWAKYQPTREEWDAKREDDRARQARKRARQRAGRHGVTPPDNPSIRDDARDRRRENRSHHPDPYVPTGRHGEVRDAVTQTSETTSSVNGFHPKPTPPGWRDPAVEALMAQTRAKLPKGRPLRNTTAPVAPQPEGGA